MDWTGTGGRGRFTRRLYDSEKAIVSLESLAIVVSSTMLHSAEI